MNGTPPSMNIRIVKHSNSSITKSFLMATDGGDIIASPKLSRLRYWSGLPLPKPNRASNPGSTGIPFTMAVLLSSMCSNTTV
ncbi:hypothetical protein GBAR_LOCUS29494 [Geodia barretti]|uniref:Uncharacterized protein n=1 Tax=Geodia barretti TaxID=519541 RepID=A0AA35TT27_GEOBA|nr:hypothetical protein GBAR_LOCUS29494 [Geodia barretti]